MIAELHARRCARHPEREAAARCPDCGGFFCRECVAEHAGRLLCAACLAREAAAAGAPGAGGSRLRLALSLVAGLLILWIVFFGAGEYLVKFR